MKKRSMVILGITLAAAMLYGCGSSGSSNTAGKTTVQEKAATTAVKAEKASAAAGAAGNASGMPKGTITVHCGSKAGGSTDLHFRFVTNSWTTTSGQNIIVQNYDSSNVAFSTLKNMKPDGTNLLGFHSGIVDQYLAGVTDVNPVKDLSVVAVLQDGGIQAVIAKPDAPYDDFASMISYAKENPGKISCAISTKGSTHYMWGAIGQESGVTFRMVEAQNETEKISNVAGGFISLGNCSVKNAVDYEKDGKVKVLGLIVPSDKTDISSYPKYKTINQQGSSYYSPTYMVLFAPAGTDQAILEAENASLQKAVKEKSYIDGVVGMGGAPGCKSVADSKKFIEDYYESAKKVATSLGILANGR